MIYCSSAPVPVFFIGRLNTEAHVVRAPTAWNSSPILSPLLSLSGIPKFDHVLLASLIYWWWCCCIQSISINSNFGPSEELLFFLYGLWHILLLEAVDSFSRIGCFSSNHFQFNFSCFTTEIHKLPWWNCIKLLNCASNLLYQIGWTLDFLFSRNRSCMTDLNKAKLGSGV